MELNRDNIKKVRDAIAAADSRKFNMRFWTYSLDLDEPTADDVLHGCGTQACIGGWAEALLLEEKPGGYTDTETSEALGLSLMGKIGCGPGHNLFYPTILGCFDATQAQGVRVLDILLETGKVDWARALAEA